MTTTAQHQRSQAVLAMSEKEFQEHVIQLARPLGWGLIYHTFNSRRSEPGFPDLVMIHERRSSIMVRELKTEKGKTTEAQRNWLAGFELVGISAKVWRPSGLLNESIVHELKGVSGA